MNLLLEPTAVIYLTATSNNRSPLIYLLIKIILFINKDRFKMSIILDNTFTTYFDSEVKRKYEKQFTLKNTINDKGIVNGGTVQFVKSGDGMASKHVPGSNVAYMNGKKEVKTCLIEDWDAFDFVDKSQIKKVNFDEASLCADIASKAIGRRLNQIIIDAINKTSSAVIGDGTAPLSLKMLLEAKKELDNNGVPEEDRYVLWTADQRNDLLLTTEATSRDYVAVQSLISGDIKQFLGFKFIVIPKMREGGLPATTTKQTALIYHKEAVGFYNQKDFATSMDWLVEKQGWMIGGSMGACATNIDDEGIFKIQTKIN